MAGHNKWTQIKRKKGVTDAKKSQLFAKLNRLISLESKKSGGNIESPGLRSAVDRAKAENMPKDAIERAIQKGLGAGEENLERVVYEAYGPEGAAIIIEGLTSNRNKASAEIKYILSKYGGSLGSIGSASWAFEKTSEGWLPKNKVDLPPKSVEILEKLLEELEENDEVQEVFTNASL